MSKYTVVSELIKIANTLDKNGYIKEANTIDQLTKKIVTSSVDEATYQKDIKNYRDLIEKAYGESDQKRKQFLQQATNQYNGVLNSMWSRYSPEQKQAWMAQSNRIRNEFLIGSGTENAPGYASNKIKGELSKDAQNFIDERVMLLGPKIETSLKSDANADIWTQFFLPIENQLKNQKKFNAYAHDYLTRTYTILMAKHHQYFPPDKPANAF